MTLQTQIEQKLTALAPDVLQVENESHMHSVPANSEAPPANLCTVGRRTVRPGACVGAASLYGQ